MKPLHDVLKDLRAGSPSEEIQALKLRVAELEMRLNQLEMRPESRKTPAELLKSNRLYCKSTTVPSEDDCCF